MLLRKLSHYRIVRKLGAGGMGEVYLAEDMKLGRKVALKLLTPSAITDEQAKKRLIREAKAAAILEHPNICAIHEVGEDGEHNFIVMQYAEGEVLSAKLKKSPLELKQAMEIGIQIADALAEAHSRGIIHRDIKPHNVVITTRGQAKVLDFGLAKRMQPPQTGDAAPETQSSVTQASLIAGTALYMSPEQAKRRSVDERSDLFSLGVLLYECVTGKRPFAGANFTEIYAEVLYVDPPPPSQLNPGVPPELDRVILKALAKDRDARYQSAKELLADLHGVRDRLKESSMAPTRTLTLGPGLLSRQLLRPRVFAWAGLALLIFVALALWRLPLVWRSKPYNSSPQALYWYKEGIGALRDGTYHKASKALERALRLDDRFALAHARLAEAWTELDYGDQAKDELLRVSALVPDRSLLPWLDARHLEAITETLTRNFPAAIDRYRKILEQLPEAEQPYAFVDLGRAYEKNEDLKNAIESYREATRRDPQYAAGFLRLGVLLGRQRDLNGARAAFEKAETLYQGLSNYEGVTEAVYQRGSALNQIGQTAGARAEFLKAMEIVTTTGSKHQQIKTLLQLSSVSYAGGDTTEAKKYATAALDLARANGLENLTAQGLIELGMAFFARREYEDAERYFRQALEFAQRSRGRRNEALALLSIARLYVQQERKTDEALSHVDQALAFYAQGGYAKETSQAKLVRGHAQFQKGDYEGALREFTRQLDLAIQANDTTELARSHTLIGSVLADQERYWEALRHFEESYRIYQELRNPLNIGYSLLNRGHMLSRLGRYREAKAVLGHVSAAAERVDSEYKQLLGARQQLIRAQIALSERRFSEAKTAALQALGASGTHYTRTAAEAKYVLGLAQTFSGEKEQGRLTCEEAIEMAKRKNDPRILSCALLTLAEATLESGDARAALATALKAQERFAQAGQQDSEWRAWLLAGRASRLIKDYQAARSHLVRAGNLLAGFEHKWDAEAFKNYAARPDVRFYRAQLREASTVVQ